MYFFTLYLFMLTQSLLIFDFNTTSDLSAWSVVDDGVMGGISQGNFYLNAQGNAVYEGTVSLENNGGFSSVRYRFASKKISNFTKVVIRLKGDGKRYQFRIKIRTGDRHAYISYFETNGEWQTIEINMSAMYPTFRGRKLEMENYLVESLEEIAFLIANKKAQKFKLEIDQMYVK